MKTYKISEIENKRILGRNVKNTGEKPLCLFWGAAALEINVHATEVWAKISADYNTYEPWLAVQINGFQTQRIMVPKGDAHWVCIARNLNPQKENLISIIKDTQPMPGDTKHSLLIHEIGMDENGFFLPLHERPLKIEFIGDSITSGEGLAGSPDEMEWITQWFCASKTYAMQTAHALNADWSVFSQCGWGLCWGWDGNRYSKMPPHYEKVCSVMSGSEQNELGAEENCEFGRGADYVVLNLGTNDNGAFFQPPWNDENGKEYLLKTDKNQLAEPEYGNEIATATTAFLKLIRKHNPTAKIIWTWGMIKLVAVPPYITKGVADYKTETGDTNVYTLELDAMENVEKNPEDKGSRGHPGPKTHYLAAQKITDFIRTLK